MTNVWTHGVWTVRSGREDEFVDAWRKLRDESTGEFEPAGRPVLLRDRERTNVFRSFGPWRDVETVDRFRAAMWPRIREIEKEYLERLDVYTLDEVELDG